MDDKILIITTGGTFDKKYDPIKGELVLGDTQIPRLLKEARCTLSITQIGPMAVDSLFMTETERELIVEKIRGSKEKKVLVIHGTDSMVETAKLLASKGDCDKAVVFTGAMVPFALETSDALFNFGSGLTALQLIDKGIYICMGGRVFKYDNVRKNKAKGIFEALN